MQLSNSALDSRGWIECIDKISKGLFSYTLNPMINSFTKNVLKCLNIFRAMKACTMSTKDRTMLTLSKIVFTLLGMDICFGSCRRHYMATETPLPKPCNVL